MDDGKRNGEVQFAFHIKWTYEEHAFTCRMCRAESDKVPLLVDESHGDPICELCWNTLGIGKQDEKGKWSFDETEQTMAVARMLNYTMGRLNVFDGIPTLMHEPGEDPYVVEPEGER